MWVYIDHIKYLSKCKYGIIMYDIFFNNPSKILICVIVDGIFSIMYVYSEL